MSHKNLDWDQDGVLYFRQTEMFYLKCSVCENDIKIKEVVQGETPAVHVNPCENCIEKQKETEALIISLKEFIIANNLQIK